MELKSLSKEQLTGEVLAARELMMVSLPDAERALVIGSVTGVIIFNKD